MLSWPPSECSSFMMQGAWKEESASGEANENAAMHSFSIFYAKAIFFFPSISPYGVHCASTAHLSRSMPGALALHL